jgi:hypothetical protein
MGGYSPPTLASFSSAPSSGAGESMAGSPIASIGSGRRSCSPASSSCSGGEVFAWGRALSALPRPDQRHSGSHALTFRATHARWSVEARPTRLCSTSENSSRLYR